MMQDCQFCGPRSNRGGRICFAKNFAKRNFGTTLYLPTLRVGRQKKSGRFAAKKALEREYRILYGEEDLAAFSRPLVDGLRKVPLARHVRAYDHAVVQGAGPHHEILPSHNADSHLGEPDFASDIQREHTDHDARPVAQAYGRDGPLDLPWLGAGTDRPQSLHI